MPLYYKMQSELTESVQQSIRPGEMVDTYYYGETNLEKQAYPCITNTRFVQNFTQTGAGSSQFVISPNQGVSDIILAFTFPNVATDTGLALPIGWGYNLFSRISVRYGSSAQYFFSGSQTLLSNLFDAENGPKRDQLLQLGGNQAIGSVAMSGAKAYVYLKLPHNSCRAAGKPLPFPSDLLVQPIVITVELLNTQSVVFVGTGGAITNVPNQLASAILQVRQEMLSDSSDLLARRVDMNQSAYTFPLMYFQQQEVIVPLNAAQVSQSVNLTGFRAGEVKSILLWLTPTATGPNQAIRWLNMRNITLTYNGEVFSRFDDESNQLWNLVSDEKSSSVTSAILTVATPPTSAAAVSYWTELPFAQVNMAYDKESKLLHGKPILNAVVNLTFDTPSVADYTLHAVYNYNASLLCSRGSAEYIF
jgi:hypothetical protein